MMKKCPYCGADIEDSARFCLYCMQSLTEKEQILLHTKKKPQWSLILAAIVALLLMLVILLPREQPKNTTLPSSQQLQSIPTSQPSDSTAVPKAAIPSSQAVTIPATQSTSQATLPTPQPTQPTTQSATQPDQPHVHSFTVENTAAKYLKDEATCAMPAQYYYSCTCGATGEELFSFGDTEPHVLVAYPEVAVGCVTYGYHDGYYCEICECELLPRTVVTPLGHCYESTNPDYICTICGEKRVSEAPMVELKLPEVPVVLSSGYRVKQCTYHVREQLDGQFQITVQFIMVPTSSATSVWDVYLTLSGLTASSVTYTNPDYYTGEIKAGYLFEHVPLGSYEVCILTKGEVQQ